MHASNLAVCQPLVDILQANDDDGSKLQQAMEYMISLPAVPPGKSPHGDHGLDYNLLQQHVMSLAV